MEAIATQKFIRMSPRKLRLVADMVRKMTPGQALETLPLVQKRAALPLAKVVRTAVANATVLGASPEALVFKEIQISEGPTLKRGLPVSRGRWHPIMKRMSHIRVVVTTESTKKGSKKVTENAKSETPAKQAGTLNVASKTKTAKKTGVAKKTRKETK